MTQGPPLLHSVFPCLGNSIKSCVRFYHHSDGWSPRADPGMRRGFECRREAAGFRVLWRLWKPVGDNHRWCSTWRVRKLGCLPISLLQPHCWGTASLWHLGPAQDSRLGNSRPACGESLYMEPEASRKEWGCDWGLGPRLWL